MLPNFPSLNWLPLTANSRLTIAPVVAPARVTLDSPAHLVLTDFMRTPAAVIEPEALFDTANDFMRRRGVRALLVTDSAGTVIGILTATDLLGEKPVLFTHETGVKRHDIKVEDLMTPRAMLAMVEYESLLNLRVGNVVATLKEAGRHHLLVGQAGPAGDSIRGIFSLNQIARQLGLDVEPDTFARTFAEVEASLVR